MQHVKNATHNNAFAEAKSMFCVREKPWHGLGTKVTGILSSKEALIAAGLDWDVVQREIFTEDGSKVPNCYANVRDSDNRVLGIVSRRYRIVQNREAFAFTDELLGRGMEYEHAGALKDGKRIWILAKLPGLYRLAEDRAVPYLVFSNTHDGSGAVKVAMTPVRAVCNNTLNLALAAADRMWTAKHTGDMMAKMDDAKRTLFMAEHYMNELVKESDRLSRKKVSDMEAREYIKMLLPIPADAGEVTEQNVLKLRSDMEMRYFYAPDLKDVGKNGYRFINAVSDFATHAQPSRKTANYQENLFQKTVDGNPLIDRAYRLVA